MKLCAYLDPVRKTAGYISLALIAACAPAPKFGEPNAELMHKLMESYDMGREISGDTTGFRIIMNDSALVGASPDSMYIRTGEDGIPVIYFNHPNNMYGAELYEFFKAVHPEDSTAPHEQDSIEVKVHQDQGK